MAELAEIVKNARIARSWSLRDLGERLGVTPAYVADIEANRRQPSSDLKERISSVLGIPQNDLDAADNRLTPELKEWIESTPQLGQALRSLRSLPDSDMLIKKLSRFISRRSPPPAPQGFLVTWESELRAIAAEASAWSIETGGDIFGRWSEIPTIFLATKAGPNAVRDNVHFRLDVDYLRQLSEIMAQDWTMRYFGDWHSHHRLGLSAPSGGDRKRIIGIGGKNQFTTMAEIIVTLEGAEKDPSIRIHPWLYNLTSKSNEPVPLRVKVLPGVSPVRQALLARRALPEQELFAWEKVPLAKIKIGTENASPVLESSPEIDVTTREKVLTHFCEALEAESGHAIERHTTGFGCIVVAEIEAPKHIAFAVGSEWPMPILDIHIMNRDNGSTAPTKVASGLSALDLPRIMEAFRAAKKGAKSTD
jgi:transcriptional regulator with XRE-family HTH domain